MRLWIALTLASCTRPNPLFLDGEGSTDAATGAATTDASTSAVTGEATTGSTGAPVPQTSSSSATTAVGPLCGEFLPDQFGFNPLLDQAQCETITTFFVATSLVGDAIELQLCIDIDCLSCVPGLAATLAPELTPFFSPGACMKAKHEGLWLPAGDPEVPTRCKTTGIALYDNATVYPLYAASSRHISPPSFLDPDVALTVAREASEPCDCAADECCPEGQATFFGLNFSYQNAPLGTYSAGEGFQVQLKEALYNVAVLRAFAKGYFSTVDDACVADPETGYVDWLMVRLAGPP